MKKLHGTDPFPMTQTMGEEAEFWVPSAAAKLGMQFLSSKVPHAPQKVIMDFLRNMNKVYFVYYCYNCCSDLVKARETKD